MFVRTKLEKFRHTENFCMLLHPISRCNILRTGSRVEQAKSRKRTAFRPIVKAAYHLIMNGSLEHGETVNIGSWTSQPTSSIPGWESQFGEPMELWATGHSSVPSVDRKQFLDWMPTREIKLMPSSARTFKRPRINLRTELLRSSLRQDQHGRRRCRGGDQRSENLSYWL